MTVVARAVLAVVLAGGIAACGDTDDATTTAPAPATVPATPAIAPPTPATAPDVMAADVPIITGEPSATMPEALVAGLVVLDGGCVRLQIEGVGTVVAVWPHGTRWEGGSIVLPDERVVGIGDHIEGGGGYYSAATLGQLMPAVLEPVLRCLPDGASADSADQVVLTYPDAVVPSGETTPAPAASTGGRAGFGQVLVELGVDVDTAPAGVLGTDEQIVCGAEVLDQDAVATGRYDEGARRCFLDAHLAGAPAAFASSQPTVEGDPIVAVWTTTAEGVAAWIDATRDAFGSGRWEQLGPCGRLTTATPATVPRPALEFTCAPEPLASGLAQPADAVLPSLWERSVVPVCGYAIRVEDIDVDDRECFRRAVTDGQPGEFAYRSVSADGEVQAVWFRSLGKGQLEAFEMVADPNSRMFTWTRYQCGQVTFTDEPGSVTDGLPVLDETCQPGSG